MSAPDADMLPELSVVVDTEEEFDWSKPFSRANISTRSIPAQARAHAIYDELGITPTYVVGYPVVQDPVALAFLRRLKEEGRAHIGAHLHPWVTPPHRESVNARNSYHCNLPPALERAKIATLTEALETAFGERPIIFKAGRHGFSRRTARLISALGYKIDCSQLPHHHLGADGGPDHRRAPDQPYWIDRAGGLLEVPTTTGFFGRAPRLGPLLPGLFDSRWAARLHLPGLLGRAAIVSRSRLTPEGVSAKEQCRLIDSLIRRGRRSFNLVYHSPSLAPGNTPYVRDEVDLARFIESLREVLTYFRDTVGGRFTTLTGIYERMSGEPAVPLPALPSSSEPPQLAAGEAAAGAGARG